MPAFEYKVVPAPMRGTKAKGVKTTKDRFALSLETVMNEMGQDGWEYLRAETLPVEERSGLTGRTTTFQHMLVFRRAIESAEDEQPTQSEAMDLFFDEADDEAAPENRVAAE